MPLSSLFTFQAIDRLNFCGTIGFTVILDIDVESPLREGEREREINESDFFKVYLGDSNRQRERKGKNCNITSVKVC